MSVWCCSWVFGYFFYWLLLLFFSTVVCVVFKQIADIFFPKKKLILLLVIILSCFWNLIPIIFTIKDIFRTKGRSKIFLDELVPGKTFKPRIFFDFVESSLSSKSIARLSLNHLDYFVFLPYLWNLLLPSTILLALIQPLFELAYSKSDL